MTVMRFLNQTPADKLTDLNGRPHLGKKRDFWDWLLKILEGQGHVKR